MKKLRLKYLLLFLALLFSLLIVSCGATEPPPDDDKDDNIDSEETINDKEMYDKMQSVLMLGQSNMAGRGELQYVEAIKDDRIFMIRDGAFVPMVEPIHDDKPTIAGACLGASFAKAFVETFDCEIGLIPGAFGGTTLADWTVGSQYYTRALDMAKAAQKTSDICAILWHQGEGDQNNLNYAPQLKTILDSFIKDLGLDEDKIIIVTGELGEFRAASAANVNNALVELGSYYENYGVASSKGLTAQDVTTHFDAPSLRVFGYRYFDIFYNKVTGKNYTYDNDPAAYRITVDIVDEDNGDYIAKESFDLYTAGQKYTSATTLGKVKLTTSKSSIEVIAASGNEKDKYLAINCEKEGDSPFVDITNASTAMDDVTVEAKFMRSAEFAGCGDLLKLVQTTPSTASIALMHVNKKGELCDIVGSKVGASFGVTLSEFEWTYVKIVCHLSKNTKDVYLNGLLYAAGLPLSASDSTAFITAKTRIMQYKSSGIGTVYFDDYKFYN